MQFYFILFFVEKNLNANHWVFDYLVLNKKRIKKMLVWLFKEKETKLETNLLILVLVNIPSHLMIDTIDELIFDIRHIQSLVVISVSHIRFYQLLCMYSWFKDIPLFIYLFIFFLYSIPFELLVFSPLWLFIYLPLSQNKNIFLFGKKDLKLWNKKSDFINIAWITS